MEALGFQYDHGSQYASGCFLCEIKWLESASSILFFDSGGQSRNMSVAHQVRNIVDLDFTDANTLYATHSLHAFPAKCPPQLARWAIQEYSNHGERVLDPMCGSGTTLVEARLLGRNGYGIDIDPLAALVAQVKATPIAMAQLRQAIARLLAEFEQSLTAWEKERPTHWREGIFKQDIGLPAPIPSIPNVGKWFFPEVAASLAVLKGTITNLAVPEKVRRFLWVAFSSLIVSRTSVANVRDLVHSRHHYWEHRVPPDVLKILRQRLLRMERQMGEFVELFSQSPIWNVYTAVRQTDARYLRLPSNSVDLVFTSPPYCNALDYTRAHAFSVAWLGEQLGMDYGRYIELGRRYIGSERGPKINAASASRSGHKGWMTVPLIQQIVDGIQAIDMEKGFVVSSYFQAMFQVMRQILRVLKPGRHAILVICPSHIRKVEVPTHQVFRYMGETLSLDGYRLVATAEHIRTIDDRRRLLPYMQEEFGRRMRTEYVLILEKQPVGSSWLMP